MYNVHCVNKFQVGTNVSNYEEHNANKLRWSKRSRKYTNKINEIFETYENKQGV
jgi:hypothetical protein